jgi:hypothetical protein
MKKDLESRMRDALRPVAPDEALTRKLIAQAGTRASAGRRRSAGPFWWLGGVAAALIVGIGVQQHVRHERELANGLEARRQVLQALQMTSQKLDLAYAAVKNESSSLLNREPGA